MGGYNTPVSGRDVAKGKRFFSMAGASVSNFIFKMFWLLQLDYQCVTCKLNSFLCLDLHHDCKFIILIGLCFRILIDYVSMNYSLCLCFTPINYILDPFVKRCEALILKGLRVFVLYNISVN